MTQGNSETTRTGAQKENGVSTFQESVDIEIRQDGEHRRPDGVDDATVAAMGTARGSVVFATNSRRDGATYSRPK